jgi:glucose-6-phosphate isomerase
MDPFAMALEFVSGKLEPATSAVQRRLSDMRGMYFDVAAETAALEGGNPLIYEVLRYDMSPVAGQLCVSTTVLRPGKIGDEYYMTKGHYHETAHTAEVYIGLRGRGLLLMQVDDQFRLIEMQPGAVAYIPPAWGHRTVNVGTEPFIFLAVCPGDAGHDYASIEREGFARRAVERNGQPAVVSLMGTEHACPRHLVRGGSTDAHA